MRLTKDEARILASALIDFKYTVNNSQNSHVVFEKLEALEQKLENFGKDKRRTGRKSQNDWSDLIKRFTNK